MFSRNGKYVINQFQEDTFNRQLPSISTKIPYKKTRQKILNVNQTKFQLDLMRQKIYQKCKNDELQYLEQLEKEKLMYIDSKNRDQKRKQQNLKDMIAKKYQIQHKNQTNKYYIVKDSLDRFRQTKSKSFNQPRMRMEFSLEQNEQKKVQKVEQNEWVNRVRQARKKLQNKFGKYYQRADFKDSSDQQDSSKSSSFKTARRLNN